MAAGDWASIVEPANRVRARARARVLKFIMMVPVLPRNPARGSVCRVSYIELRQVAPQSLIQVPEPDPILIPIPSP